MIPWWLLGSVIECILFLTVRVCYCGKNKPPICDATFRSGGFHPVIVVALALFLLVLMSK